MSQYQQQLEGVPGYGYVMDKFNEYAEEKWNSMDPYRDADGRKRRLDDSFSKAQRKTWKQLQHTAWQNDMCFLGSCGVGLACGVGMVPLAVLFVPALGPIVMYAVHARIIHIAQREFHLPPKLVAKLQSQILIDLLISLPPVIGAYFSWMHGCLTRNIAYIYGYLMKEKEHEQQVYVGQQPMGDRLQGRPNA